MGKNNTDGVSFGQTCCKLFGTIDRAMLSSGTTEGHHQMGEAPLNVFLHTLGDECLRMFKEEVNSWFLLKEFNDRAVFTG